MIDIWMDQKYKYDGNRKKGRAEGNDQRNRCGLRALMEGIGTKRVGMVRWKVAGTSPKGMLSHKWNKTFYSERVQKHQESINGLSQKQQKQAISKS